MSKSVLHKNIEFFNLTRAMLTPDWQQRVPQASADNFADIGHMLLSPASGNVFNEWLQTIVNRIGKTIIRQPRARNKLSRFWRSDMRWGDIIEEIGFDVPPQKTYLDGKQYVPNGNDDISLVPVCEPDPFCKEPQENTTHFHRRNREIFYKRTIFRRTLMKAFTGETGFTDLIQGIIDSMYTANRHDQYLWAKETLSQYINSPRMPLTPAQTVSLASPITDDPSAREYLRQLKTTIGAMSFNSGNFNPVTQLQYSDESDLVLLVRYDVTPIIDVETLVGAFNPEALGTNVPVITVDDFGTGTWNGLAPGDPGYEANPGDGVVAMLIDERFLNVTPNDMEFASLYNPEGRYWNYWLHCWETYWISYFMPAVIFKQ